jgi:hypothetical protein
MDEQTMADEVIEAELDRFFDKMDIATDRHDLKGDDLESFVDKKKTLVAAMRAGRLVIDDQGQPVYTPKVGITEPITFHEPTGASYMAMDQGKEREQVKKMFNVMADMTGQPANRFANMKNRDLKVCMAVAVLFLAG